MFPKTYIILLGLLLCCSTLSAQNWTTRVAKISFNNTATQSTEPIEGLTRNATLTVAQNTGIIEVAVLMKSFQFPKALMQKHFNDNYLESEKYPKAKFNGKIDDISKINFGKDGTYSAQISGEFTLHGVTKPLRSTAIFTVKSGKITVETNFKVALTDFNIIVPVIVADKFAKEAKVAVIGTLEQL